MAALYWDSTIGTHQCQKVLLWQALYCIVDMPVNGKSGAIHSITEDQARRDQNSSQVSR